MVDLSDVVETLKSQHDTLMENNRKREEVLQKKGVMLRPDMILTRRLNLFFSKYMTDEEKWQFEIEFQEDMEDLLEQIEEEVKGQDHGGLVVPGQNTMSVEEMQRQMDELKDQGLNRKERRQRMRDMMKGVR